MISKLADAVISLRLQEKFIKRGQFTAMYTNEGMQIVWTWISGYKHINIEFSLQKSTTIIVTQAKSSCILILVLLFLMGFSEAD